MRTSTAQHLAALDALTARVFPDHSEYCRSALRDSGPGHHVVPLATSEDFWEDDGTRRLIVEDRYEAERDALAVLLDIRWGAPRILGLRDVLERGMSGEDVPEPWATLSCHVPDLYLWRAGERWIGLGVAQWDKELPFQLVAVVTTVDPP
ncbi:hypothetical protein ABZ990_14885 [Streptomyces sp. NPDC046203]|uniref:hypothetical protein n=1 Tax=Streptomyces sp. NPDC046203 TaxID=3154602 RepID=UPI0033D90213